MNAVEFRGVSLRLANRAILEDIDLTIGPNEFVGLLGPNGSGKTTLIRSILGLVTPARGTITVLGQPATRGNVNIGYMPQVHRTFPGTRLRGWDFVASVVGGERLGLPVLSAGDRKEIDRVIDLVSASTLAKRPLYEISGGERQRLLLAQALIGNPRLLLLDEPLVSLDPRHQDDVVQLVKKLQAQLGITVLFSAHELNPLIGTMNRVLYLGAAHAELGTVDEVITGPVLSRLYGSDIDVVRVDGRVFVMSGGHHMEEHHTGPHSHPHA
ncbi:MAG: metal ABC transporter ATP-binding protein [Vulcanimicrobiaceae bacterium]